LLLCLVASAFFSFSETCLTSLSESKAHAILARGSRHASVLELWLAQPHEVLTTILIGNNVANNYAPVLMTALVQVWTGKPSLALAGGLMTVLVLLFGEITPKILARQYAERTAVPVLLVLRAFYVVIRPATWLFVAIPRGIGRVFGWEIGRNQDVTEDEIQAMIDLGRREGVLAETKGEYLRAVFELADRQVRDIMVARMDLVALDLDLPPEELVRRADGCDHSRIPVYRGSIDDIVGVLHVKDLLHLLASSEAPADHKAIKLLLRQPRFVPETMKLETLLATFRSGRQHLAVALDEFGGTAGIVTLEDVLEELVGEIRDEHDPDVEEAALVAAGPQRWTAPGRLPLAVLERELELEIPRGAAYETLGGLLMDLAGTVPKEGQRLSRRGWKFEVLTGDDKRVGLVRIERPR
jgi:putative hemolysin